jgi:uncharacterized protein with von Willebrand factor type A (vWA) domain
MYESFPLLRNTLFRNDFRGHLRHKGQHGQTTILLQFRNHRTLVSPLVSYTKVSRSIVTWHVLWILLYKDKGFEEGTRG